jgi:hypothetical protein
MPASLEDFMQSVLTWYHQCKNWTKAIPVRSPWQIFKLLEALSDHLDKESWY